MARTLNPWWLVKVLVPTNSWGFCRDVIVVWHFFFPYRPPLSPWGPLQAPPPLGSPRSPASKPRAWAGLRLALAWLAGWLWLSACLLLRISAGFPLDSNSGLASAQDFMWISASGFHLYQDFDWISVGFGLISIGFRLDFGWISA